MADVVKVLALVVCIVPVGVRVPVVAATKMDIGKTPCTECAPMVQNRTLVEDQLIKAELRLYKKKKKKKRYDLYCNPCIIQYMEVGGHMLPILAPHGGGGVEHGSISNIDQHGLRFYTKFGAFFTI